jgi:flagellar motor switch protein FliM
MTKNSTMEPRRIDVGRLDSSSPLLRTLTAVHEGYARDLGTALSAFLRADIQTTLREISGVSVSAYLGSLPSPTCLMVFRLHPRADQMYLYLESKVVFGLLEILLGGTGSALPVASRNLTEIEWSLLEEVVRVVVRPLAEAWNFFATVEFEVDSLISEPSLVPVPQPAQPMIRMAFDLAIGQESSVVEMILPTSFLDGAATVLENSSPRQHEPEQDLGLRIQRLQDATVDLEVRLDGPTVAFQDLLKLQCDQVVSFDYPLDRPLRCVLNDEITMEGQIVSTGRKRAFRVVSLPGA